MNAIERDARQTADELAATRDARAKAIQLIHDVERGDAAKAQDYIVNALMMFYHRGGMDALDQLGKAWTTSILNPAHPAAVRPSKPPRSMQDVHIYYDGRLIHTVRAMRSETPEQTVERAKRALLVVPGGTRADCARVSRLG